MRLIWIFICSLLLTSCTAEKKVEESHIVSFLEASIPHIDPMHATNKFSSIVVGSIFEGLYHYHYLKRPITIEPLLAEGMPVVSEEGRVYTIKIKKGVRFQDDPAFEKGKGRELKASDFIYSWKRLADPRNKALGWWVFDGIIDGLNEWRDNLRVGKSNYNTPVSGLKVLDEHTLQITLTRPSYQFIHTLAMTTTMVVAKEVVEKYGKAIDNHPVGTGPYQLEEWIRNSKVDLVKNPHYHNVLYPSEGSEETKKRGLLKSAGKKLPLSDKVTIKIFRERQPLWLAFVSGEVDHGIIPKSSYSQAFENNQLKQDLKDKGVRIHHIERPDIVYITFNMEHPVLGKHPKLRKAIAKSIDTELLLKNYYNNRGVLAEGPIPPTLDAYDPNYKNDLNFDLDEAKKLIAEAGFPEGKGLPVFNYELTTTSAEARQQAEFIKDQMAQIGVQLKLVPNSWPQFDKKIKEKKADIFEMAWTADYPDSENFLQLYYSKNVSPGPNNSNYINRKYDTLFEKAVKLPVGPERDKLFRKLVKILNKDVPAIFVLHRRFRLPYHGWLENYNEFPIIYDYYKYLKVDVIKKKQLIKKF